MSNYSLRCEPVGCLWLQSFSSPSLSRQKKCLGIRPRDANKLQAISYMVKMLPCSGGWLGRTTPRCKLCVQHHITALARGLNNLYTYILTSFYINVTFALMRSSLQSDILSAQCSVPSPSITDHCRENSLAEHSDTLFHMY